MSEITATLVKTLRERTGAGILACRSTLVETGGDLAAAIERLRDAQTTMAAKKADRVAVEGLVALATDDTRGAIVEVNCETDFVANTAEFRQLAKDLTHQIAATAPIALRREDIPPEVVAREREIYRAQVEQEKKPEHVRDKIVEGRLNSFYEERVLLEQKFVKDGSKTIGDMVKELAAKTGENVVVRRFVRFERGGN